MRRRSALVRLAAPDACAERFADAEAHGHGDADDEDDDENLGNDAVSLAQAGQTLAALTVLLGRLGLSFPVVLAGPHMAVGPPLGALG